MILNNPIFLHQYFLQFADSHPDASAVSNRSTQWTYRDLKSFSCAYADQLSGFNMSVGDRVLLEFDPCPQAIAIMIACSMLGFVFIPVSPDTPQSRVVEIIRLSEVRIHIQAAPCDRQFPDSFSLIKGYIEKDVLCFRGVEVQSIRTSNGGFLETDLAYIIFTSGTTGRPKGIMMSHKAVISFFKLMVEYCNISRNTRVGTISPLQFDFSLLDMGLAFGSGGELIQVPRALVYHPQRFIHYLAEHRIQQMNGVPSIWGPVLQFLGERQAELPDLNSILYAGERFPLSDLLKIKKQFSGVRRIINCFGQSESIACSFVDIFCNINKDTKNITIGKGQPGSELMLIDEKGAQILEPGITGEIYLRGSLLFSGYWKEPELTNKALVPNPLRPYQGERVFRTGDLAYKGTDGELYYVGRKDMQVKIFGNRVELEEIENRLREHPAVIQVAVVIVREQEGPSIWAYAVFSEQTRPSLQELRVFCSQMLPAYMLPAKLMEVECIPTTINGKMDRDSLIQMMKYERV
jgi:amino acid adenylation domain-containing protein